MGLDRFIGEENEMSEEKLECPSCRSPYLHKYGENFEAEFFECEDCQATFERRWNGEVIIASSELELDGSYE